jgi:DNA-binding PadR family transcriptional regulator
MFRERRFDEERFFRSSKRWASFQKGDLKYVILDLLKDKPRHGYDIIRELEEQSYGFYKPSPGVIYPTLQMLEEMGYASSTEQEGKKIYSITDEGLNFLATQSNIADDVRRKIKHKWSFKSVGRMVKVMKKYHSLEHLLGDGFRSMDTDKAEQIYQILSQAYQDIESVLQE